MSPISVDARVHVSLVLIVLNIASYSCQNSFEGDVRTQPRYLRQDLLKAFFSIENDKAPLNEKRNHSNPIKNSWSDTSNITSKYIVPAAASHNRRLLGKGKRLSSVSKQCNLDQLPTDLSSKSGGSEKYGGPQQALDGSIEFHGPSFSVRTRDGEFDTQVERSQEYFSSSIADRFRTIRCMNSLSSILNSPLLAHLN